MILPQFEETSPAEPTVTSTPFLFAKLVVESEVVKPDVLDKKQPIVIIGLHGWEPKIVQGFVKLDSNKFCVKMAEAIRLKLKLGPNEGDITSIPLDGYGTILGRYENYLKKIKGDKTKCDKIKNAKALFVVAHSQGVPVSVLLMQKLIEDGLVNPDQQKICACLMASISQGPNPRFDVGGELAKIVGDDHTAGMFELQTSSSKISQTYRDATMNLLKRGVKFVYFASGNDEAVPLHSALYSNMDHPSIKRGIYVAGYVYEEKKFIAALISILLRIRNNNHSDHGLLVLLSDSLIGYLKDGGHTHLHEEPDAYKYAFDHLNSKEEYKDIDAKFTEFDYKLPEKPHMTYVPWAMRGLLSDEKTIISEKLSSDFRELRNNFKTWSPRPLDLVANELKCVLQPFGDDTEARYIDVYQDTMSRL